jgi:isopentenyldiphosphate isomerase
VLVLVFNAENKVYLQKRSKSKLVYPGRWDLSATGHVQRGESCEDAALREAHEELGLTLTRLKLKQELQASADTGFEFISLFTAGRVDEAPWPNPNELEDGHFFDRDEVGLLVEQLREQLTPGLVYFYERGLIFDTQR